MPRPKPIVPVLDQQKAVIYCRVSSAEQSEHGISLEAQEATLRAYCTMKGLEIVDVLVERGVSGSIPLEERPQGRKIAELTGNGAIGAVIVTKLDRAFRDTIDCLRNVNEWEKRGVAFHALDIGGGQAVDTSSFMGKFFLTMIAAAAELERCKIRERIRDALNHLKNNGKRLGGPCLGEKLVDGKYVEDPAGVQARERAIELTMSGYSRRKAAEILNEEGHRTQRGQRFTHDSVQSVILWARKQGLDI